MGKKVLVLFKEAEKPETAVGEIIEETSLFITIRTHDNVLRIPISRIIKIKERRGD